MPPVVAIPVGPGPEETDRVADLVAALRHHEPGAGPVVLVDDAPADRRPFPDGAIVLPNPRAGRGIGTLGGTCTGTLTALRWAHEQAPGAWVLRLDTDALVTGPIVARVEAALAEHTDAGVLGSCHRTCTGERRDVSWWSRVVPKHARAVWAWRRPPLPHRHLVRADPQVRAIVRRATAAGYRPGEHCMAAGCAISGPLLSGLAREGWLEEPNRWLGTLFGDDVMLGAMARALGLDLVDLHAVFGLKHVGLAAPPAQLAQRGFGVVHSVKNDPDHDEAAIRAFFAARRREAV